MSIKQDLIKKYSEFSKHSHYQILPNSLKRIIGVHGVNIKTRFEKKRLDYILKKINIERKSILDIGGNIGYFTFEFIEKKAKKVHYYEGNKNHSDFVKLAASALGIDNSIKITNNYFSFSKKEKKEFDVILLLNVLHHVGDDYGNKIKTIGEAKAKILSELNSLEFFSEYLIFQMGFNWKGKKDLCFFENGTKKELIDFVRKGIKKNWDIVSIGIAQNGNNFIEYVDLNSQNIERNDDLGEFLNRPIFIFKSKTKI